MEITPVKLNSFFININNYKLIILYGKEQNKIQVTINKIINLLPDNVVETIEKREIIANSNILHEKIFNINWFQKDLWKIITIDSWCEQLQIIDLKKLKNITIIITLENLPRKNNLFSKLAKSLHCATIGCYKYDDKNLLIKALYKEGLKTKNKEIFLLLQKKLGFDEKILNNEVRKLKNTIYPRQEINLEDVENCIISFARDELYNLVMYFAKLDFQEFSNTAVNLYNKDKNLISLIYVLYNFCEKLFWYKYTISINKLGLDKQKYYIDSQLKDIVQQNCWSCKTIGLIYNQLLETEIYCKKYNCINYFLFKIEKLMQDIHDSFLEKIKINS